jgi:hypothetical protein
MALQKKYRRSGPVCLSRQGKSVKSSLQIAMDRQSDGFSILGVSNQNLSVSDPVPFQQRHIPKCEAPRNEAAAP